MRYLAVPPPAKECAVRDPCLEPLVSEELQVRADHVAEGVCPFTVRDDAVVIADVIVAEKIIIAGDGQLSSLQARLRAVPAAASDAILPLGASQLGAEVRKRRSTRSTSFEAYPGSSEAGQ